MDYGYDRLLTRFSLLYQYYLYFTPEYHRKNYGYDSISPYIYNHHEITVLSVSEIHVAFQCSVSFGRFHGFNLISCILVSFIKSFQRCTNAFSLHTSGLEHDKINKITCSTSEDSDQPNHPFHRVSSQQEKRTNVLGNSRPLNSQRKLIRLDGFTGWSESLLDNVSGTSNMSRSMLSIYNGPGLALKSNKMLPNWKEAFIKTCAFHSEAFE